MGAVFYRGINPSGMDYTELRYYHEWHTRISETELREAERLKARMESAGA